MLQDKKERNFVGYSEPHNQFLEHFMSCVISRITLD